MNLPTLPAMPLSPRQTVAVLGLAVLSAVFVLIVYHYATRPNAEPGA